MRVRGHRGVPAPAPAPPAPSTAAPPQTHRASGGGTGRSGRRATSAAAAAAAAAPTVPSTRRPWRGRRAKPARRPPASLPHLLRRVLPQRALPPRQRGRPPVGPAARGAGCRRRAGGDPNPRRLRRVGQVHRQRRRSRYSSSARCGLPRP